MTQRLIPPSYLFTFSLPIYHRAKLWAKSLDLEPTYRIPSFVLLDRPLLGQSKLLGAASAATGQAAKTEDDPRAVVTGLQAAETKPASKKPTKGTKKKLATESEDTAAASEERASRPLDVRVAWSEEGMTFQFRLSGKTRRPYCRLNDLEHSDAVEIYVDTRNTKTVHRATRYCHRFLFLPTGTGTNDRDPYGSMLKIHLARGEPATMGGFMPQVESKMTADGYWLTCHLSRKALEGWSPAEQPEIGIFFQVRDSELGLLNLVYDHQLPVGEDPSLWPTAFLARLPNP